jgi:hypothetical protein
MRKHVNFITFYIIIIIIIIRLYIIYYFLCSYVNVFNFINIVPFPCFISVNNYFLGLLIITIGPFIFYFMWILLYYITSCTIADIYKGGDVFRKNLCIHFIYVSFIVMIFVLPGLCHRIVNSFRCINMDPDYVTGTAIWVLR